MIGDYDQHSPKLITEKLAGNIQGCMGFVLSSSGKYIPNTILKGRTDDFTKKTDRVLLIYRKKSTDSKYQEIVRIAKKVDWNIISFPDNYPDLPMPFRS